MTQENLKQKNVQSGEQNPISKNVQNKTCKKSLKSDMKTAKCVQNKKQTSLEIWDNLDVIPPKAVYPNDLPADNVDAALYLMNLNK